MKIKRQLALVLVLVMLVTAGIPSYAYKPKTKRHHGISRAKKAKIVSYVKKSGVLKTKLVNFEGLKKDKKIRVVVEMKGKPLYKYYKKKTLKNGALGATSVETKKRKLVKQHRELQKMIGARKLRGLGSSKKSKVKVLEDYYVAINGFSAIMTVADAKRISKFDEVKKIHRTIEYNRPRIQMSTSNKIIKAPKLWELGYKGEGQLVAVLDTGIDVEHKDMKISKGVDVKLNKADAEEIAEMLDGKYYTKKVPYGYNYADKNDEIKDLGRYATMHGMHVSGTVGANGDVTKGGVRGVAPEAQLLGMKVFGNGNPTTSSDIYIKAIEDSIVLGADVINMSLGSVANFVPTADEDPTVIAIENAINAGIEVVIASGNSDRFGAGYANPRATDPDVGVVGLPAVIDGSFVVASIEDDTVMHTTFATTSKDKPKMQYKFFLHDPVEKFKGESVELVDCGLAKSEDFTEEVKKELQAGKLALVKRGELSFKEKVTNAQLAGAKGIVVFNNENDEVVAMGGRRVNIPAIFIGKSNGEYLKANKSIKITFDGSFGQYSNPNKGKMSEFSSWGTATNLDFKPEVTAPGGQIHSTLNDNKYGTMSGTSMATPHIAGGTALVYQRVKELNLYSGRRLRDFAKKLIMSTAVAHKEKNAFGDMYYVSPRRQGAGVMDLSAALNAKAVITNPISGETKVALKEIGAKPSFEVEVENFSDEDETYTIEVPVFTDIVKDGRIMETAAPIKAKNLVSFTGKAVKDKTITVPKNSKKKFSVNLSLYGAKTSDGKSLLKAYPNGAFVDGFVILKNKKSKVSLSMPFTGFYGKWGKAPIIDSDVYGYNKLKGDNKPFYEDGGSGIVSNMYGGYTVIGSAPDLTDPEKKRLIYKADQIGFSPNNDGQCEYVFPRLTFLRNAKEVKASIRYTNGGLMKEIANERNVIKNFFGYGVGRKLYYQDNWKWDGKNADGKLYEDGDFIYRIEARVDGSAKWQKFDFPVYIDVKAPFFMMRPTYDEEKETLDMHAQDDRPGGVVYMVLKDNKMVASNITGSFKISKEDWKKNEYEVVVMDHLMNTRSAGIVNKHDDKPEENPDKPSDDKPGDDKPQPEPDKPEPDKPEPDKPEVDKKKPHIVIDNHKVRYFKDEKRIFVNKHDVKVKGHVKENEELKSLTMNGKELKFKKEKGLYNFEYKTSVKKDGKYKTELVATDKAGNKTKFVYSLNVDTMAPKIKVDGLVKGEVKKVSKYSKMFYVEGYVVDNARSVKVYVNKKRVVDNKKDLRYTPIKQPFYTNVGLVKGKNKISIVAKDLAGNESKFEAYVEK